MANQITIDPTEYTDAEYTSEEQESLEIGEKLAEQEQELLAGKYRSAEELERAYLELQQKFGSRNTESEAEAPEPEAPDQAPDDEDQQQEEYNPAVTLITEASTEFFQNGGTLSADTIEKFSELSSRELVEAYVQLQQNVQAQPQDDVQQAPDLSEAEINVIQNSVGGEAAYQNLVQWAAENLPSNYVEAFDSVVESGSVQAIQLAVAGLQREYENNVGYEGRMLSGKAAAPADVFRSQAEVVRAMSDPRYDNDPAYRQDIFEKLERSNIDY
jgi:hypothetical protein